MRSCDPLALRAASSAASSAFPINGFELDVTGNYQQLATYSCLAYVQIYLQDQIRPRRNEAREATRPSNISATPWMCQGAMRAILLAIGALPGYLDGRSLSQRHASIHTADTYLQA